MMKASSSDQLRYRFDQAHPMPIRRPSVDTIDQGAEMDQTSDMTDTVSRYELDAKLETIEVRMDARIARIEDSNKRIEEGMSSLKTTVIVTGVSAFLAVVAANIGLVQTMFGAFESGKTTATAITEASATLKQTQEELKAIRERLDENSRNQMTRPQK